MKTEQLIDDLAAGLAPVPAHLLSRILAGFLMPGALVSALLMLFWLGLRPDLRVAVATAPFWMKFAYTASLAVLGIAAAGRAARPGGKGSMRLLAMLAVAVVLGCLAVVEWASTPPPERLALLWGHTVAVCWERIILLSLPLLGALLLAMRRLAPTRLRWAGFAAGMAAGAMGALVYSFHCDESAAVFVSVWYTLGIVLTGMLGSVLGSFVLRWR